MSKNIGWKLLIPIVILLAVLWYQLVYVPTRDSIAQYDAQMEEIETSILVEQAKHTKMTNMLNELEELKTHGAVTEIAAYDNIQNVMNSLNVILGSADQYDLDFSVPVVDEETGLYRRVVDMTFETSNLLRADQIIRSVYASPYRCVIGSMELTAVDETGNNNEKDSLVEDGNQVKMQLTYYEMAVE